MSALFRVVNGDGKGKDHRVMTTTEIMRSVRSLSCGTHWHIHRVMEDADKPKHEVVYWFGRDDRHYHVKCRDGTVHCDHRSTVIVPLLRGALNALPKGDAS